MRSYLFYLFPLLFLFCACDVFETDPTPQEVAVTGISLNLPSAQMLVGETVQLQARIEPSNATDKTVTWSSSRQSVATVSADGLVTAVALGTSTITASAGGQQAVCTVTVEQATVAVSSVVLSQSSAALTEGESLTLVATVLPADATDKTVTWSSSDESIATVDQNGKVTAVKEGTASVTAAAGGKTGTCVVKVAKIVIPVTGITLDKTQLNMARGESVTLTATVSPNNATDQTVTWSSTDATIAYVTQDGTVVALKAGSAVITAKAGEKMATCVVTITVPVESIRLDRSAVTLEEGGQTMLIAYVSPSDATDQSVTWSSSAPTIASVDAQGQVTALVEGTAVITAKAGEKSATCEVTVAKKVIPVSSITLDNTSLVMIKGETATLMATVSPADATDKTVTWSSSDATIASVDQSGKVTALKGGSATITAKAGDVSATCEVSITVPVQSITLDKTSLELTGGATYTLTATVNPSDATDKTVTWSTSDAAVATVDQNGKVSAINNGNATITASAGGMQATCSVTVSVAVESIALDRNTVTLEEGQTTTLIAMVSPSNAADKTVTWSSSNEAVATVDQSGKLTAVKEGSATITAKAGGKSATCAVTVAKSVVPVTSVTLDKSSVNLTKGQSVTLVATVLPADATNKTVTWSSTDNTVASVNQNGQVTALKGGSATITAKAGEMSATCQVSITVPVQSVSLDKQSLSLIEGNSATLIATINPSDATDNTLSWSSSNTSVATVDQQGMVTAVKEGTATITVTASGQSAQCSVTVSKKIVHVSSITLDKTSLDMSKGQSVNLIATLNPADATFAVSWISSNTGVASVDNNGKVTAVGAGNATITAKADGKMASCSVTVTVDVESVTLDKTSLEMVEGDAATLKATVNPSDATNRSVSWQSSNSSVVTVDATGGLKAVSAGSAVITASAGGKLATCQVTVIKDVFSLSPTSVSVGQAGDTFDITVTAARSYHITSTPGWITEIGSAGKVHTFKADANTADDDRSGIITFCDVKGTCLSVSVQQKGTGGFKVTPATIEMDMNGGTAQISIVTGLSWTVSSNASWCQVSGGSGTGNASLTITVAAFPEKGTRTAIVTITSDVGQATVTVEQEGKVDFAINPSSVTVEGEGGTFEVKISSSVSYHINSKPSWISEISKDGKRHTFKVEANSSLSQRSGVIVFCDDEGTCLPCNVTQKGKNPDGSGDNEDVDDGNPINW